MPESPAAAPTNMVLGPGAGASQPPGQPPVGSSPATQPMPNKGNEASGLAKLGLVIRLMENLVPLLGTGSEAGKDVLQALSRLAKHVPAGMFSQGVEKSAMDGAAQQNRQMAAIQAMKAAGAGGGAPPPGAGAAPPMAAAA